VDTHRADEMAALRGLPRFTRVDVPGADHTFTSRWSQELVSDVVTAHLARLACPECP
jgi:hypothetical protein